MGRSKPIPDVVERGKIIPGPVTVGSILARTFSLFTAGFLPFLTISALIHSPLIGLDLLVLVKGAVSPEILLLETWGAQLLLTPIATAALVYGVFRSQRGHLVTTSECIRVGLSRWLPVILLSLLVLIASGIGYMFCVIPGFVISCGLFVAVPALVVEELSVIEAYKRSWHLAEGYKLTFFGVILLLGVIGFALGALLQLALGSLLGIYAQLAQHLVTIPMATLQALAAGVAYYQLRLFREGLDEEELAAVFD